MIDKPLKVLIIDDEEIIHATLGDYLRDSGHEVASAYDGNEGLAMAEEDDFDVALIDVRLPGIDGLELLEKVRRMKPNLSAVIITAHGNMDTAIQALRLGAADFLNKPVKLLELDAVMQKARRYRELKLEQVRLVNTIGGIQSTQDAMVRQGGVTGSSPAIHQVREKINLALQLGNETVLVTGEVGTGKETAAREIHYGQPEGYRKPFIAVSCTALDPEWAESDLFGHVKGAFPGANSDKTGYVELADGGTLYLEEIADLSNPSQDRMLKFLNTKLIRKIGAREDRPVGLRLIATTSVDLEAMVEAREFLRDLYLRLNLIRVHIPPLRERKEDIAELAALFIEIQNQKKGFEIRGLSPRAMEVLADYDYPGNISELRNIIERAAILCREGEITADQLNLTLKDHIRTTDLTGKSLDERTAIKRALEETRWNRREAAKLLKMPYSTLRYKINRFGIE